jgi:hypothetical protein
MIQQAILSLVAKTMENYAIIALESCVTTCSFDLWMSRFGHDTFVLVINFLNSQWVPWHVTMGIFEATNVVGSIMYVKELLSCYNLLNKLMVYVKDEGGNLFTFAQAFNFVVSCVPPD